MKKILQATFREGYEIYILTETLEEAAKIAILAMPKFKLSKIKSPRFADITVVEETDEKMSLYWSKESRITSNYQVLIAASSFESAARIAEKNDCEKCIKKEKEPLYQITHRDLIIKELAGAASENFGKLLDQNSLLCLVVKWQSLTGHIMIPDLSIDAIAEIGRFVAVYGYVFDGDAEKPDEGYDFIKK